MLGFLVETRRDGNVGRPFVRDEEKEMVFDVGVILEIKEDAIAGGFNTLSLVLSL